MEKSIFVTLRIDYETDGRMDEQEEREYILEMAKSHLVAFPHTIEEGLTITDCGECDFNL
jgi:hypothetical protein